MNFRTDLALENKEYVKEKISDGVLCEERTEKDIKITRIKIINESGEKLLNKPKGLYITFEHSNLLYNKKTLLNACGLLINELKELLPKDGLLLVAGLGNKNIAPDSLGSLCINKIIATRHLKDRKDIKGNPIPCRPCVCCETNILEKTGIETFETILAYTKLLNPSTVIIIDALASREIKRIGTILNISTSGITPGSGVGQNAKEISCKTLNVPVITIGIPTIVDLKTFTGDYKESLNFVAKADLNNMFITSKNIDLLVHRGSDLISRSINLILQNKINITE